MSQVPQPSAFSIGEAIRIYDRLQADRDEAIRNLVRPGKRLSGAERERRREVRDQAQDRLNRFLDVVDPDRAERGMRMAREVRAEEDELLKRTGF